MSACSSDVCSSDLLDAVSRVEEEWVPLMEKFWGPFKELVDEKTESVDRSQATGARELGTDPKSGKPVSVRLGRYGPYAAIGSRSEEHTSELQSLMRISYAVFCLKKKNTKNYNKTK